MKHKQEELRTVYARLDAFRALAEKAGRADDARVLAVAADLVGICIERFGLADSPVRGREDEASAMRTRLALVAGMRPAPAEGPAPECCPYSDMGCICSSCGMYTAPAFTVQGGTRRYLCLTKYSMRPGLA